MTGVTTERPEQLRGGLVVVSGPSGSGKTTLVARLAEDPCVDVAVTATTRPPRPNEKDGVDYHFLSKDDFRAKIARGDFVEHKEVFGNGNYYGSLKAPLVEALENPTRIYLLEIDVEGGLDLKRQGYEGTYVFIAPPSIDALRQRIEGRGTETPESIAQRIGKAEFELSQKERYDHVVVNDDLERAFAEVRSLLGLPAIATENDGDAASSGRSPQEVSDE